MTACGSTETAESEDILDVVSTEVEESVSLEDVTDSTEVEAAEEITEEAVDNVVLYTSRRAVLFENAGSGVIGSIASGTEVTVTAQTSNGYYKITTDEKEGYVLASSLTTENPNAVEEVTVASTSSTNKTSGSTSSSSSSTSSSSSSSSTSSSSSGTSSDSTTAETSSTDTTASTSTDTSSSSASTDTSSSSDTSSSDAALLEQLQQQAAELEAQGIIVDNDTLDGSVEETGNFSI